MLSEEKMTEFNNTFIQYLTHPYVAEELMVALFFILYNGNCIASIPLRSCRDVLCISHTPENLLSVLVFFLKRNKNVFLWVWSVSRGVLVASFA